MILLKIWFVIPILFNFLVIVILLYFVDVQSTESELNRIFNDARSAVGPLDLSKHPLSFLFLFKKRGK